MSKKSSFIKTYQSMFSKQRFALFLVWISAFSLFVSSCKNKEKDFSTTQVSESLSAYINAYTSGIISKAAPIRIQFSREVVPLEEVGREAPDGLLRLSPRTEARVSWETRRTLLLQPMELLQSGKVYEATVDLKALFPDVPSQHNSFTFDFKTRDQFFNLNIEGLQAAELSDISRQELHGTLFTTDVAAEEEVEKTLQARQGSNDLTIAWNHSPDQREHRFVVQEVQRGDSDSKMTLAWNGQPLSVDKKGTTDILVPAIGNFSVISAEVVQSQEGQYALVRFSDPLQADQDLRGMITIKGFSGSLRFVIDRQFVRVYPNQRLFGSRDLLINRGIRNVNGKGMPEGGLWVVEFQEVDPQVRLVDRGVIVPESDGLLFPFEAVGLEYVEVEIHKIFNNNILQFLQNNSLSGNYDLRYVSRIIMQKPISLRELDPNLQTGSWRRYALDLSELIEQDPQAIYQVVLGFRPGYGSIECENFRKPGEGSNMQALPVKYSEQEYTSLMDGYYGVDGYYEDYRWDHRDDPCQPAYYNNDRFVRQNVLASNIGLMAKGDAQNRFTILATDLRNTLPLSGINLEFYDFQQQLLAKSSTNGQGKATVSLDRPPFVVVAKRGEERGYLRLLDQEALSLSRFDVSGEVAQKGLKGYVYGERGVWRPGDSLFLQFVLEDENQRLPSSYPVQMKLVDPRGQVQMEKVVSQSVQGVFPFHFATAADAPTGTWMAHFQAGGATFSKSLKIETIKPNRLKIRLDFPKESLSFSDSKTTGNLQVNWLHGAPAGNLKTVVEAEVRTASTSFEKYPDFAFEDPARQLDAEPQTLFEGTVNEVGAAAVPLELTGLAQNAPGKVRINFRTRAFEKGGDASTDQFSIPYSPYSAYAGVHLPEDRYGSKRLEIDKTETIEFVLLDDNGQPLANKTLDVGLYRVSWRWWWERSEDRYTRYNSTHHRDALQKITLTTDSKGKAQWEVTVNRWGRYMVRACAPVSGHCTGDFFYAGYPWYDSDDSNRESIAMLGFTSDKENYDVGEKVSLTIPTGEKGRCLISLESGTQLLGTYWMEAEKGDNVFSFEATAEMAPTVYAHVTLLQPHAQMDNDLPIRMYGVIPIRVEDPATRLSPKIEMPEELAPEESFTVKVSEANKKGMAYTVAIVDEGLLDLTRFRTPNPWDAFYAREALGINTWDVYDEVLGAYGGQLERILSIGGDAAAVDAAAKKKVNRFKPVVLHAGPFYLSAGQQAEHTFTMPNYVGSVRAMVVACDQGAYGNTEKTVPVKQPLMVLATLPRVLGPTERLRLPVNVFVMEEGIKQVNLQLEESSGLVEMVGPSRQNISFSRTGDQMAYFDIKVRDAVGVGKFTITATSGAHSAQQEIELEIRNPNPPLTKVIDKNLPPGESWSEDFLPIGVKGTNTAMLEVSHIPPIDLGRRLQWLIRYPHGCVEQTTSSGFPQLMLAQFTELTESQKREVERNVSETIQRLKSFQQTDGGFAYWPGASSSNFWGTTYAGHFLLEAKAQGYNVSQGGLDKWTRFQQRAATEWSSDYRRNNYRSHTLMQAYRLYTLALAGKPALGAMNQLREVPDLSVAARWKLAGAYALAGKSAAANEVIQGVSTEVAGYQELSNTYGSDLRDRAMILETLVALEDMDRAGKVAVDISKRLSQERWYSTQTLAYCLVALGKYLGDGAPGGALQVAYQYGGANTRNLNTQLPILQESLPVDLMDNHSLVVTNTSNSKPLYVRLILIGQPLVGDQQADASDLKMTIRYTDMEGNTIDPALLLQGTDFLAEVSLENPGTLRTSYEEMALSQVFPSGWEIINSRMSNIGGYTSSMAEYQDIRDDRVYTYFDIYSQQAPRVYRIQLNAAYQGRYYLPTTDCSAMYDNSIYAQVPGQWVEVVSPEEG